MTRPCKQLIINADDFNLTAGVSRGILHAIEKGIVTSTTVLVNRRKLPAIGQLARKRRVSVGLHFNCTNGALVAPVAAVPALTTRTQRGTDAKKMWVSIPRQEIEKELCAQLERFKRWFSRLPSHIDSHHHIHSNERVYSVLRRVAQRLQLPIRKRNLDRANRSASVLTTTHALYRFDVSSSWRTETLVDAIKHLRKGVTELIVHPGYCDQALQATSSFATAREEELRALLSTEFRDELRAQHIALVNYKQL